MQIRPQLRSTLAGVAVATLALACSQTDAPITNSIAALSTMTVNLDDITLTPGQTTVATAVGADQIGTPFIEMVNVRWTSTAPAVATVSPAGLVSALTPGTTQITATVNAVTAQATLTVVSEIPVASVTVNPVFINLLVGMTQPLTATTLDSQGNAISGHPIDWSSTNTSVATVSASGLVQAISVGSATIIAASDSRSATATVSVTSP